MRPRPPLPSIAAPLLASCMLLACVPTEGLLEGRPCPCAEGSGYRCVDGVCVEGAPRDAGSRDAGRSNDAGPDAGPSDAGPSDAGPPAPPPVPTDCWTQPTPCDWSDPEGFDLVAGEASVLAELTISSNPTFSPDGCLLFYNQGQQMRVARRADARSPFVDEGPINSLDQSGSNNSKATMSPDGLQLFFTSNRTDGMWHTIHRTSRAVPEGPWGVVEEVSTLSFPNVHNWDGVLAPHGLRYYWAPQRPNDDQDLFVGERAALDEPFSAGVAIAELAGEDEGHAEPAITADGRVLLFIREVGDGESHLAYTTRPHWDARFGEVHVAPGSLLEAGPERESTLSPNACEVVVHNSGAFHYLRHQAR